MDVLVYLIPFALTLGLIGLVAFYWAFNNYQYEYLDGATNRILFDEESDDK